MAKKVEKKKEVKEVKYDPSVNVLQNDNLKESVITDETAEVKEE